MAAVSIIIPVYNVENYVDRCLNSVTRQTYPDIEIIAVNDGSTDRSGEKCLEWAKRDDKIIYVSKKNEGAGPTRNLSLQMASTEFVAFWDPDNWYDERYIELMLAKQRETGADIMVCGSHDYDCTLDQIVSTYIPKLQRSGLPNWNWQQFRYVVWVKLFRRSLFIEYDIKMPACCGGDTAIHHFIMTMAKSVAVVEQPLYYYWYNRVGSYANSSKRHPDCTVTYLAYGWELFIRVAFLKDHRKRLTARKLIGCFLRANLLTCVSTLTVYRYRKQHYLTWASIKSMRTGHFLFYSKTCH